jgi:precorrin-6Y C5,15-methyltransferase (decarboxylating)
MSRPVAIVGIGADGLAGLSPRARSAVASATFLAGGRRHLELAGSPPVTSFTITNNLEELVERLLARAPEERCVVLASGDPLFYGIGHLLTHSLGSDQVVVEPALSSLQLAFARAGVSWHDAAIASVHGRPLKETLLPLLGKPKIGLFTQDGTSPSAVAHFLIDRDLHDYEAIVGENLGANDERVSRFPLPDLAGRTFGPLNILILLREPGSARGPDLAGERAGCIPDALFAQPEKPPILLTHADVRAIVVGRFEGLPAGPLWDLGAGLGGVAVGLARAFPAREVVAAERSPEQASYLRTNRLRFRAYNLRVVEGIAPACLGGEADPAGVFLGGSGGHLDAIFDSLARRLLPRGILVANFVGLENLGRALERLRQAGWPHELSQVQISPGQDLAGLTVLTPQRPVWVVRASRP